MEMTLVKSLHSGDPDMICPAWQWISGLASAWCLDSWQMPCTVIRFLWVGSKLGTCTVVSVNGTLVKAKMCTICTFTLESTHFIFNKCPIYTYDGASAKFSTNSQETDYSVLMPCKCYSAYILVHFMYVHCSCNTCTGGAMSSAFSMVACSYVDVHSY